MLLLDWLGLLSNTKCIHRIEFESKLFFKNNVYAGQAIYCLWREAKSVFLRPDPAAWMFSSLCMHVQKNFFSYDVILNKYTAVYLYVSSTLGIIILV